MCVLNILQKQAIDNIEAILKEAGTDLSKIISRRTYFMNIQEHLGPTGAEWAKRVGEPFPAATAIQITCLALRDALLEIEVVAEIS